MTLFEGSNDGLASLKRTLPSAPDRRIKKDVNDESLGDEQAGAGASRRELGPPAAQPARRQNTVERTETGPPPRAAC